MHLLAKIYMLKSLFAVIYIAFLLPFVGHAKEIEQIQQLFAVGDKFNPSNNQLGIAVSIDGQWAVVGSDLKTVGDNNPSIGE